MKPGYPGMVWASSLHEGRMMTVGRFTCAVCQATLDVPCNRTGAGPMVPTAKARHSGWIADPDKPARDTRCPNCIKPKSPKKEKPMKVETEIKVTSVQRVQIRGLLDRHFDDGDGMYLDGMSDDKIALAVQIPRAVVESMREAAYGPIRVTAEIVAMREQLATFCADLDALRTKSIELTARIAKLAL